MAFKIPEVIQGLLYAVFWLMWPLRQVSINKDIDLGEKRVKGSINVSTLQTQDFTPV